MRLKQKDIRKIHAAIREVVKNEPDLPYTDAEIAEKSNAISHQNVTQNRVWYYRKDLGIPSCGERRKEYKAKQRATHGN